MKTPLVVEARMIATCVSDTSWCLRVARLRFRNDQNFRKFWKILKKNRKMLMLVVEVMTIALRLSDTSWCLQVSVYDFETIEIFWIFRKCRNNWACTISKFCVCNRALRVISCGYHGWRFTARCKYQVLENSVARVMWLLTFLKKFEIFENVKNPLVFKQIVHRRRCLTWWVLFDFVVLIQIIAMSDMLYDSRLYWPSAR